MLFCTTCCAQCVDCPVVSHVCISFVCESADLIQQMVCRAGRNDSVAYVHLLFYETHRFSPGSNTVSIYQGTGCIRYRLQQLLDGKELAAACKVPGTFCSHCANQRYDDRVAAEQSHSIAIQAPKAVEDVSPRKGATKRSLNEGKMTRSGYWLVKSTLNSGFA